MFMPMKTELEGGSKVSQVSKIETRQLEQFFIKTGLEPAQMMSISGWIKEGSWTKGVDWKRVNWPNFKKMVGAQRWSKESAPKMKK